MPNEIELKLRIARKDAPRLRHHPTITAACREKPITRKLVSVYFDTPELTLYDHGISLRVRRMSGNWYQAVKAAGKASSGLHERLEWEDIIASDKPDYTRMLDPSLQHIFSDQTLRDALNPIFRTEVRRTEWQLQFDNGDKVELALDLGQLVTGQTNKPICEIELELKAGNPGRLFDLALELQQDIPLELENVSKAQYGYRHYRQYVPSIVKARLPALSRNLTAQEALKLIIWECLNQLQGNLDMVLLGENVEGVHQMRVALRRLRSAFTLFRPLIGKTCCDAFQDDLRWITNTLGVARDLDVFITQTLPLITAQFPEHKGLIQLRSKALIAQKTAYEDARVGLLSQRYQHLILAIAAWIEGTCAAQPVSLLDIAETTLTKRNRQLRQHGRRLMHMHPEERHATRIAAKKLRYAAEFFSGLYPTSSASRSFLHALTGLQDSLGLLNDISVTENLLRNLIGTRPERSLDEAFHIFSGWNGCNAMHSMGQMEQSWRGFARTSEFWKK